MVRYHSSPCCTAAAVLPRGCTHTHKLHTDRQTKPLAECSKKLLLEARSAVTAAHVNANAAAHSFGVRLYVAAAAMPPCNALHRNPLTQAPSRCLCPPKGLLHC